MKLTYDCERIFEMLTTPMIGLEEAYRLKQMRRHFEGEEWKQQEKNDESPKLLVKGLVTIPTNLPSPLISTMSKFARVGNRFHARTNVSFQGDKRDVIVRSLQARYKDSLVLLNNSCESYVVNSNGNAIIAINNGKAKGADLWGYEFVMGDDGALPLYLPENSEEFRELMSPLEESINISANSVLSTPHNLYPNLELIIFPD